MESRTNRYQSRILREMHHNTENPFNSPPSSTGSHGTVTMTSDISLGPQGESTRRFEDAKHSTYSRKHTSRRSDNAMSFNINTSALGRAFPEWDGWDTNDLGRTEEFTQDGIDDYAKENFPPSSSTVASPTHELRPNGLPKKKEQTPEKHAEMSPNAVKASRSKGGNVTTLLQTLKTAQGNNSPANETSPHQPAPAPTSTQAPTQKPIEQHSPKQPSNFARLHMERQAQGSSMSPVDPNQTGRSFFLPDLSHINDFVSGTLRLSTIKKNGMPVFVKHGKVLDESVQLSPNHAEVEAIEVPEDEEKIFVSLDKIRDEIQALQEHDEHITKEAERMQDEVDELKILNAKLKSRRASASGSDSGSAAVEHLNVQKSHLEDQVAALQARLDKANRKVSVTEIEAESYMSERDEALKTAAQQMQKIKQLQSELALAKENVSVARDGSTKDMDMLQSENISLRSNNNNLRQQYKSMLEENQSLREHNDVLEQQNTDLAQELSEAHEQLEVGGDFKTLEKEYEVLLEEKEVLKQDNLGLERNNDKFYNDFKLSQQKYTLLERRVRDLQEDNARLYKLLDAANAQTGTMTVDVKDIKDQLEQQKRQLMAENSDLQQKIIDLQADLAAKRISYEHDKRMLSGANDRLSNNMEQLSKQFDQILRDTKAETTRFEQKQSSLNQQLQDITEGQAAFTSQLKDTTENEIALHYQNERRNKAASEAREITKEIQTFMSNVNKVKPVKVTRIVEPSTGRSRATGSEVSGRSVTSQTDMALQDDYTRQIDLTKGSDFENIFTKNDMPKLRETLRQLREQDAQDQQDEDLTEESADFDDDGVTGETSQSLPPIFIPQDRQREAQQTAPPTSKPLGILKNANPSRLNTQPQKKTQHTAEENTTGRFSIRSGFSGISLPSQVTDSEFLPARNRRQSNDRAETETHQGQNLTSALFMDDITLESRKQAEKANTKRPVSSLSKDAKRVLDSLTHDHDCRNCFVCARINSHEHENDQAKSSGKKKTVRVERPVAVTDRPSRPQSAAGFDYEDGPTIRPAQNPAIALATVMKSLKDEEKHIVSSLNKLQNEYNALDPSVSRRQHRSLSAKMGRLIKERDMKRQQIYTLHDALEGQKASGQEMTASFVEVTINSVMSRDDTWQGISD